jgi:hypothetical protein
VSELEEDVRATADDIAHDAARLAAIEQEKRAMESSDPRFLELSAAADVIAKQLVPKTVVERVLARESQD